jgi:hypothetical protein
LNVSADSFYSSQGRRDPLFEDRNEGAVPGTVWWAFAHADQLTEGLWMLSCRAGAGVLDLLRSEYPAATSMEMETFQLLALVGQLANQS